MPKPYQPTEDVDVDADPVLAAREKAALREGTVVAVKSAAGCAVLSAAALLLGFYLSKSTFTAADHILKDAGDDWQQAFMPAALFGMFGLAFGALIGWRISTTSGLAGGPAWRVGAGAVVIVSLIGIIGATFIHTESLPKLVWISSGVMAAGALGSVTFFAKWNP